MPTPPNATDTDIIAMLRDGHSNSRIVRELHVDKLRVRRIRTELGLPAFVRTEQTRTIEDKWRLFAKPIDGGHMQWTGTLGTSAKTPVLSYKERMYAAASIAFRIKHGRDPQGYAIADCGMKHCVAPDHIQDEAGRQQARRELRARRGLPDIPAVCVRGHDQTEHNRLESDGTSYCEKCKVEDHRFRRDPSARRTESQRPTTLVEAFARHTRPADGGHVLWVGSTSNGSPIVAFGARIHSAYKIAFRVEYEREPEGVVTSGCDMALCVAGAHVEDRPLRHRRRQERQRAQRQERQLDRLYAGIFGGAA